MIRKIKDVGASVRARLLNASREKGLGFDLVLTRYAVERLLYRLAESRSADRFVLKGAALLMTWFEEPFRGTRDLDLLGFGDPAPEDLLRVFREILRRDYPDGVLFDADALRVDRVREANPYGGLRLGTTATIGGARVAVQIDVGFGDAAEPPPEWLDYPVLLDMPAPRLRGYAVETVVAEKFHAIVLLGMANSRMKDYFDLWMIRQSFGIDRSRLARAISATFARRGTEIPHETPDGLSKAFAESGTKRRQWESFRSGLRVDPGSLESVVGVLADWLVPVALDAFKEPAAAGSQRRNRPGIPSS